MHWQVIAWAAGAVWTTQGALLCAQSLAAFRRRKTENRETQESGVALLLIPAHNEATTIFETLSHFDPFLSPALRGAVLCDNCTDGTAEIVRRFPNWILWSRSDPGNPGKGAAVQAAARHAGIELPQVDVLVISDTDSRTDLRSLNLLIAACRRTRRTVQSRTRLIPCAAQPGSALSSLAWWWHNEIRESGRAALGWGAFLQGTGMAFPRRDFVALSAFPTSDVEDKTWTVELHRQGRSPRFVPAALWTSKVAEGDGGWRRQRRRWELGHIREIARRLPEVAGAIFFCRDWRLIPFLVDFSVPPLFLFVALGFLRAIIFPDAFFWIGLGWTFAFAGMLATHYLRDRPVASLAPLLRELAPWLRAKIAITCETAQILFWRKGSLW